MNANEIIKSIEAEQLKAEVPQFRVGDTVKVYGKIKEGNRERIQVFEGTVLKRQGGSNRETFTVRKISNGVGVEKTWPLHSPNVEKVEVVRQGKVRRAKLFYLRDRVGKKAKVKELVNNWLEKDCGFPYGAAVFFYDIGNCFAVLCHNNTLRVLMRTCMRGSIASRSCAARQKCASFTAYYSMRVWEAHFCSYMGNFVSHKVKPSGVSICGGMELFIRRSKKHDMIAVYRRKR